MPRVLVPFVLTVLLVAGSSPRTGISAARFPDIPNPKVIGDAPEIGRYGGTYVVSGANPRTLNPIVSVESSSDVVLAPLFDRLVEENYLTGEIEPGLAESWAVSADRKSWTFTLRQGLSWSDGMPLTADDVLFTFAAIFADGVTSQWRTALTFHGAPVRVEKVDEQRVRLFTSRSVGLLLRTLAAIPIVPRHKLQAALSRGGNAFNTAWGINTPPHEIVGSGPYILEAVVQGQRITYLRNPKFWKVDRAGNRLPYITRFVRVHVPNPDAARLKFLSGEIDVYFGRAREFAELQQGARAGNYTVYDGPEIFGSEFISFNQNPAGVSPLKLAWFQDVRFRRALAQAVDRNTIVQLVYGGRATPALGPVTPALAAYAHPNLPRYAFDLERVQQALSEAGYHRGPDGTLRDPQGNEVEFTVVTNAGNPERVAIGNLLRQDWQKLGIRVTFAPEDFNALVGRLTGSHRWEVVIIGFSADVEPGRARDIWLSSGTLHLWRPRQDSPATSWEAEVDRLFEQIAGEPDASRRRQLYLRWQEVVAAEVPLIYTAYPKTQPAVRNTLGNVKIGLGGSIGRLSTLYYKIPYR